MLLTLGIILLALVFEYINGFHDTANAIATVVSTRVLTPRQAVLLAASFDLCGALVGVSVATTIGRGLVDTRYVGLETILCALLAAILWNLATWWLGLPSSSSHALIGGLCGATLASADGNWHVIHWAVTNPVSGKLEGLWPKVIAPMFISPVCGIVGAFVLMLLLYALLHRLTPSLISATFGKLQIVSASFMGFSHGTNDAQKTMGIIALVLYTASNDGTFSHLPSWLGFLRTPRFEIALWVKFVCACTMAAGTASGGWRIIRTLGHRMVRLLPIHGFAAETTAATVIQIASHFGIPISTTHVISASIMGVGATHRFSALKWGIVGRIVWAWVLTLPITLALAYGLERLVRLVD
jgi:inorganic phosphate transporter, PiT family